MADNYLEKKYEELRQGRPVLRRNTPSLDSMLKKIGREGMTPDPSYVVKQAQLDAVVRSASLVGEGLSFETFETSDGNAPSYVKAVTFDSGVLLGQAILAIRLKAAELGLCSKVEPDSCQIVYLFRAKSE